MTAKSDPAKQAIEVTTSDSPVANGPYRSLYIGVSGNVKITDLAGNDATFLSVPVGFFPVEAATVWATGTTATGIVGLR